MTEPTYSFTIPSIHDDTPLDCRIYHPRGDLTTLIAYGSKLMRGAVVAHPYAPLGGTSDDSVVLAVTECLLARGYFVVTFNFRGAGGSAGKTSWTGKPEIDDYSSVTGLIVYYLSSLSAFARSEKLSTELSLDNEISHPLGPTGESALRQPPLELLLAGYSFGSLILSRLPGVPAILQRFESAEKGTAPSEIYLRARTLAKQKWHLHEVHAPAKAKTPRDRRFHAGESAAEPTSRNSPVTLGGEETDASERRRSRDSRRSVEVVHSIKTHMHMHRHSGHFSRSPLNDTVTVLAPPTNSHAGPAVMTRYLLISPVLLPLSTSLLSPGLPFTVGSSSGAEAGVLSLKYPMLIAFGSRDTFTASRKLRQWAEKLARGASEGLVQLSQIDGAGHFWRERGVMEELQSKIQAWIIGEVT